MTRKLPLVSLTWALAMALGACDSAKPEEPAAATPAHLAPETANAANGTAVPANDTAQPVTDPIHADSPEDAVRAYYAAIDAGEFARAYQLWANAGAASGQSFAQFRQGFAATRSTEVTISGPVSTEGAAGTIYATVPVEVNAVLKDGTRQRFAGEYVLRQANNVPGATEEQLNWRIHSASLEPA